MSAAQEKTVDEYRDNLDSFLQYIPTWVKVATALALGSGYDGRLEAYCRDGW